MRLKSQLKLKTKLNITQNLLEAIELHSLTNTELSNYINQLSEENIMIEPLLSSQDDSDNLHSDCFSIYYKQDDDAKDWADFLSDKESYINNLIKQICLQAPSKTIKDIAIKILYSLDDQGYFKEDYVYFCKKYSFDQASFQQALNLVQEIEPAGLASADIKDFLKIQIIDQGLDVRLTTLIDQHLESVKRKDYKEISEKIGVTKDKLLEWIQLIASLRLSPFENLDVDETPPIQLIPDFKIEKKDQELVVRLANAHYHGFRYNKDYINMIGKLDYNSNDFLSWQYSIAKQIEEAIRIRDYNMLRIAQFIVSYQSDFFLYQGFLKPLSNKDIASYTQLSESTVSRVLANKYIEYDKGIKLLSSFLSHEVTDGLSQDYIKEMICMLIKNENKTKPLSDQAIVNLLEDKDIQIARRTVAKYRNELNIPNRTYRKES